MAEYNSYIHDAYEYEGPVMVVVVLVLDHRVGPDSSRVLEAEILCAYHGLSD